MSACGGHSAKNNANTTTTAAVTTSSTSVPSTTTTSAPTTSSSSSSTTVVQQAPPAGGSVPTGFDPVSFTAVSDSQYWLLGTAPCKAPICTSIVRTTDAGVHFVGLPAPVAPLDTGAATVPAGAVNTLHFADALNGYAYDPNGGTAFWSTHDGGESWAQPALLSGQDLLAFGTGGGYAFALVGTCQASAGCSKLSLERSPVSSDSWSPLDITLPAGAFVGAGLAVYGDGLWVSLSTNAPKQVLFVGSNSGASFATYTSPCYSGLGGTLEAASADALWALCPTGTLAALMRSTDGGVSWQSVPTGPPLPNSALLAAFSSTDAIVAPAGQGPLIRTTDGGATWQNVQTPMTNGYWVWLGPTDSSTGSAISSAPSAPPGWPWPNGPLPEQLWRSTDGGASWSGPVSIG